MRSESAMAARAAAVICINSSRAMTSLSIALMARAPTVSRRIGTLGTSACDRKQAVLARRVRVFRTISGRCIVHVPERYVPQRLEHIRGSIAYLFRQEPHTDLR